jgi:hypothetical protein
MLPFVLLLLLQHPLRVYVTVANYMALKILEFQPEQMVNQLQVPLIFLLQVASQDSSAPVIIHV